MIRGANRGAEEPASEAVGVRHGLRSFLVAPKNTIKSFVTLIAQKSADQH
jgi:hypothetical protein